MPTTDALGLRMKAHEHVTRAYLPKRRWTILRLDGRAFHSYTRGLERPFDEQFASDMDAVAAAVAAEVTGTVMAYVQSDEMSLLITDFATPTTEAWFAGNVQKTVSLSAARASVTMNALRPPTGDGGSGRTALFDARVFCLDDPHEVAAYFVWRQRDCIKNATSMAAQNHFSPKQLHGLHTGVMRGLLWSEKGVNFDDYPDGFKRGRVVTRESFTEPVVWTHKKSGEVTETLATRHRWVSTPAPVFDTTPDGWLLADAIPARPAEPAAR